MKKLSLLSVLACITLLAGAQTTFKLTTSLPTKEYIKLSFPNAGKYVLKETSYQDAGTDKGKFTLFSADHKKLAQTTYQLPFKPKPRVYTAPILNSEKLIVLSGSVAIAGSTTPYVFCWDDLLRSEMVRQDYNPATLKPMGAPVTIPFPKGNMYSIKGIRSTDGNYFAILGCNNYQYHKITYRLFNNAGEVFTKDFELPWDRGYCTIELQSIVMGNNGDVVFLYGAPGNEKASTTQLAYISAAEQKLYTKKLDLPGKLLGAKGAITLTKDGGFVVAVAYGPASADTKCSTGFLVEKYGADFGVQAHSEIPYSAATMEACKIVESTAKGTIYKQVPLKIHTLENGGYILVTEQQFFYNGGAYGSLMTNNTLCFSLNAKLENQYQRIVRLRGNQYDFKACTESGSYVSGNRIYVFHSGTDATVRNTPDEFDLFCTWWDDETNKPTTAEIVRPEPDFILDPRTIYELEKNKLLFSGKGKGGQIITTMQIENL